MPSIDYTLTTGTNLTKEQISTGLPRELTPTLELGKDNRTWNTEHLKALRLILCNFMVKPKRNRFDGIYLYSRKNTKNKPKIYNPHTISLSALKYVIDALGRAGIIDHRPATQRKSGVPAENKLSEFRITQQALDFAFSLGINPDTVKSISRKHVRLRDRKTDALIPFEWDEYTTHIEQFMTEYCSLLNQHSIMLKTDDEPDKGIVEYGDKLGGEHIHLYRSYRNYSDYPEFKPVIDKLSIDMKNPNFAFGGRAGSYWMGGIAGKKENRPTILINGNKTKSADFPCMNINLCYLQETDNWYQTENKNELRKQGRIEEDGYYIPDLPRDIPKKMIQLMLNVKGRRAVSMVFNKWLANEAEDELFAAYKEAGLSNIEIMDKLEKKHQKIKKYFYKGMLVGQIISFEEANTVMHLALYFMKIYKFPVLTIHDEFLVEEEYLDMVNEFMYSTIACELCQKYSLMDQIKHL